MQTPQHSPIDLSLLARDALGASTRDVAALDAPTDAPEWLPNPSLPWAVRRAHERALQGTHPDTDDDRPPEARHVGRPRHSREAQPITPETPTDHGATGCTAPQVSHARRRTGPVTRDEVLDMLAAIVRSPAASPAEKIAAEKRISEHQAFRPSELVRLDPAQLVAWARNRAGHELDLRGTLSALAEVAGVTLADIRAAATDADTTIGSAAPDPGAEARVDSQSSDCITGDV